MKAKLVVALSLMISLSAFANPTDKSLEELSKHAPYEAFFYEMVTESIIVDRENLMYALAQNTKLTDNERNQALQIYDNYAKGFLDSLSTPAVQADLKKSYLASAKSVFKQNEVNAQLAFYGSTDGQNALKKRPAMVSTYLNNASNATKNIADSYKNKHAKKLQSDLDVFLQKK